MHTRACLRQLLGVGEDFAVALVCQQACDRENEKGEPYNRAFHNVNIPNCGFREATFMLDARFLAEWKANETTLFDPIYRFMQFF